MKQTSIEWLINEHFGSIENCTPDFRNIIEQALAIHKEEIVKAAARGYLVGEDNISLEDAKLYGEEYYDITFKTK